MSNSNEKYLGESPLKGGTNKKLTLKLKEESVNKTHLSQDLQHEVGRIDDLQNQIDSLEVAGVAVSNQFGDNQHISISQKALTAALNKIWYKIEDISGESLLGFQMETTPEYYIGEEGCNIHVVASTVDTVGSFEYIAFYINGVLAHAESNVSYVEFNAEITETSVVECRAKVLGVEYSKQTVVVHYSSFWLGAGSTYSDVMNVSHVIPITNGMRGAYDVNVLNGQHIFIVIGESLRAGFYRADINGIEIPFTETTKIVGNKNYRVFTSVDIFEAGTYNIDING